MVINDLPVVVTPAAVPSCLNAGGIAILGWRIGLNCVLIIISPSCGISLLSRWVSIRACK